jgi:hypothetical protein
MKSLIATVKRAYIRTSVLEYERQEFKHHTMISGSKAEEVKSCHLTSNFIAISVSDQLASLKGF